MAEQYHSPSQRVRVLTEAWVDREVYCPNCGANVANYENNRPVADFFCPECSEDFELKSKSGSIGPRIVDGAHRTMLERLKSDNHPNFFLLNYDLRSLLIRNFFVVPKHFFVPDIIEKRKPLSPTARRAGWVGCNILLNNIPLTGKIYYIRNGTVEPKEEVLQKWHRTLFLREETRTTAKGWLLDIIDCIDKLDKREFYLDEVYAFENSLRVKHPNNKHIRDKIRQQLQVLRDKGYLEFTARGKYKLI